MKNTLYKKRIYKLGVLNNVYFPLRKKYAISAANTKLQVYNNHKK